MFKKVKEYLSPRIVPPGKNVVDKGWLNRALERKEFKNKTYLSLVEEVGYVQLKRIVVVVEAIDAFRETHKLKHSEVHVLDTGCGWGNDSLSLASLGYSVFGVDMNEEAIIYARKRAKNFGNAQFSIANGKQYLQTCNKSFNAILSLSSLEHMQDPIEFIHTVYEHLLSPGIFVVCIPNGWGIGDLVWNTITISGRRVLGIKAPPGWVHLQRFRLKQIQRIIAEAGFQYQFVSSINFFTFPFFWDRSRFALLDSKVVNMIPKFMANAWVVAGIKDSPSP